MPNILKNAGHDPEQQPPRPRPKRSALEIQQAIATFDADPADSPFQRGYLSALRWVAGLEG